MFSCSQQLCKLKILKIQIIVQLVQGFFDTVVRDHLQQNLLRKGKVTNFKKRDISRLFDRTITRKKKEILHKLRLKITKDSAFFLKLFCVQKYDHLSEIKVLCKTSL